MNRNLPRNQSLGKSDLIAHCISATKKEIISDGFYFDTLLMKNYFQYHSIENNSSKSDN